MSIVDKTLSRLRKHMGLDIAYVAQLDGEDMIIRAHCAPDLPATLPDQLTLPRESGFCHYMVKGDIPSVVQNSADHPAVADIATRRDFNIQSYIGVPLHRSDGTLYGSLCCVGHTANESLNERDLRTIKLFSEIVIEQIDKELEDRQLTEQRQWRINSAISDRAFSFVFQPIVGLQSGQLKGFEALCRFQGDPPRSPDKWFEEAAQIGLGVSLEAAAVQEILPALDHLREDIMISINVSPDSLMSDEFRRVLPPEQASRLILEVTEHAVVEDYLKLKGFIEDYKAMGFRIAVDDAGAGYSSLRHIIQLQPDIIKLDMSLTRNIHEDQVRRSLANALVYFANETQAEIVAEGIETAAEHSTLTDLDVNWGQGYFFSKPMPLDEAQRFVRQTPRTRTQARAG